MPPMPGPVREYRPETQDKRAKSEAKRVHARRFIYKPNERVQ